MPERLVLDASAAIAVIRREPSRDAVVRVLADQVARGAEVFVPDHFWLEVANVLARRYRFTTEQIVEAVRELDEFGLQTVVMDRPTWLLTLERMAATGLAAYDAVYLAVSHMLDGLLLTLDGDLVAAAGSRAVPLGPRRLAETSVPYDVGAPDQVWAEFGGYLAQLRREALAG